MSGVRFFMFIVALPALVCLGHDLYIFYLNQPDPFMFSSAGFLWTRYSPESFAWAKDNIAPAQWDYINFALEQKAFYIGLAFSLVIYFLLAILQLFRLWPFNAGRSRPFSDASRTQTVLNRGKKPVRRSREKF